MISRARLAVVASIGLSAMAPSLLGQGPEPHTPRVTQILRDQPRAGGERDIDDADRKWLGMWRLNLDKSVYLPGPVPYKRATMKVERLDGRVRFSYDFVHPRGGVQHLEWTGSFDGNDYMVQGIDEYMTYAYTQLTERTYEIVAKVDGHVTAVAAATFSADGRTLTTATRRRDARGQETITTTIHERVP